MFKQNIFSFNKKKIFFYGLVCFFYLHTYKMDMKNIRTFKSINEFVTDLSEAFGKSQRTLVLYKHLLGKTKVTHNLVMSKHINIFKEFVMANKEAIKQKKESLFAQNIIKYSDNVFIDMKQVFEIAGDEEKKVIWSHLLVLMNTFEPTNETLDILKQTLKPTEKETNFISNLVQKIEKNIDPNASDPMSAIMGLMSSGVINDVVSSISTSLSDGTLDVGRMIGSVKESIGVGNMDLGNITNGLQSALSSNGIDMNSVMGSMTDMFKNINLTPPNGSQNGSSNGSQNGSSNGSQNGASSTFSSSASSNIVSSNNTNAPVLAITDSTVEQPSGFDKSC